MSTNPWGAFTDVGALSVGHCTHASRPTGCTVVLALQGAVAGVDVRGAAPGTRETDLLEPGNLVPHVHAVVLSGGSAFGLDAASGVMRWLQEQGVGLDTGFGRVPIVPAAVLFDLPIVREGDDPLARPDAACGYAAAQNAQAAPCAEGNVGAGTGATVGKLWGPANSMRGGIGQASVRVGPWVVSALIACNAVGDVLDPATGRLLAGARAPDGRTLLNTQHSLLHGVAQQRPIPGTNTTIGVLATNARLDKAQARRLATCGHDGLARSIRPVHTQFDGDTLFALATGSVPDTPDLLLLGAMAAEAVERATVRSVLQATGLQTTLGYLPSAADLGLQALAPHAAGG